jgi:cytochrome oxidase Cu insertion factor (SCO1/SenC/PrrC family)
MATRARGWLQRGTLVVVFLVVAAGSVWAFQNRSRLAAACLDTVDGVTSKLAHLNQPFGSGETVAAKNPSLGVIPDFTLTERSGRPIHRSDLLGNYWVASFVFTRCATTCPMATAELAKLQSRLPGEVRLVSFSVDPEHDSPEVLTAYANRAGAELDRWLFLTGEKESVYRLVREGFHLAAEENTDAPAGWEVTHSPRFALVDPKGVIRGYYESSDAADLDRMCGDIARLRGVEPEDTPRAERAAATDGAESSLAPE